jgi:hypothetical protein
MNKQTIAQKQESTARTFFPVSNGVLQRKCACGNHTVAGGECAECRKKRLQRKAVDGREETAVLSIVHEVLRSPGRPLDAETRAFMESRFAHSFSQVHAHSPRPPQTTSSLAVAPADDRFEREADRVALDVMQRSAPGMSEPSAQPLLHDFSNVRVHTDAQAAQSARLLNARAYTVGQHIVFARDQYSETSAEGRRLLAHELTHVVQQTSSSVSSSHKHVQRARLPCTSGKTIPIYAVTLPGSSGNIDNDLRFANDVLCQCGISLSLAGGQSWTTNLMDQLVPKGQLNEYTSVKNPTQEELALMAYRPGGNVVHVYYVPQLSNGSRAETIGRADCLQCADTVVVSNSAVIDSFAHEFVHILLPNDSHHDNADNLFARGTTRNVGVGELEQTQCNRMQPL